MPKKTYFTYYCSYKKYYCFSTKEFMINTMESYKRIFLSSACYLHNIQIDAIEWSHCHFIAENKTAMEWIQNKSNNASMDALEISKDVYNGKLARIVSIDWKLGRLIIWKFNTFKNIFFCSTVSHYYQKIQIFV